MVSRRPAHTLADQSHSIEYAFCRNSITTLTPPPFLPSLRRTSSALSSCLSFWQPNAGHFSPFFLWPSFFYSVRNTHTQATPTLLFLLTPFSKPLFRFLFLSVVAILVSTIYGNSRKGCVRLSLSFVFVMHFLTPPLTAQVHSLFLTLFFFKKKSCCFSIFVIPGVYVG